MLITIVSGTLFLLILSLMAVNRYFSDSENLSLIKIGVSTLVLNIGILLFIIISFKNLKLNPGPVGPKGKQGNRGQSGNPDNCKMCDKPVNTFGNQGLLKIEQEKRLGNILRDFRH